MRTFIFGMLALLGVSGLAKADFVAINGQGSGTASTRAEGTKYIVFSANSNGYNLSSVNLWGNSGVAGTITFNLYDGAGTSGTLRGTSSTFFQTEFSSATGESLATFSLGAGIQGVSLTAGNNYTLAMTIVNGLSLQGVGTISAGSGFTYNSSSTGSNAPSYGFQINAVPEPGTLFLGGIAAICGGSGVWWKRRRKGNVVSAKTESTVN